MGRKINVQVLVDFAERRKKVDPWQLVDAAKSFYESIKTVGIEDTEVTYKDGDAKIVTTRGDRLSERTRAFALHVMRLLYRWDDVTNGRLETHYKLSALASYILADTGVFKHAGLDLACTNVQEMIETWAISE